jgi:hypothetical protein
VDHARKRLEHENSKFKETIGERTIERKNDWQGGVARTVKNLILWLMYHGRLPLNRKLPAAISHTGNQQKRSEKGRFTYFVRRNS